MRRKINDWGRKYPFMMWIPTDKSPDSIKYQAALRDSDKDMDFLVVPDEDYHIWGFKSLTDQMRFCEHLKQILTKC